MSRRRLRSLPFLAWCLATAAPSLATIPPLERAALIALYNATNGPGWTNSSGWLGAAGTECSWYGVTCNTGQTTVQTLELGNNHLSGTMPTELGSLSSLQGLHLASNQLSGSIPTQLGNLGSLWSLYLYNNQLSGSIPTQLGNLTGLRQLWLGGNSLSGSIPTQLGSMSSLEDLDLGVNHLTGSIPTELRYLSALGYLNLETNQLSGTIPTQLGSLSSLQKLELGANQLSGTIPTQLSNLANLYALELCCNQLTGTIPTELGYLRSLGYLRLSQNQLTGTIPMELGYLRSLGLLWLSQNQLTGNIPTELGGLTTLQTLDLEENQLTGSIPTQLGSLRSLWQLQLGGNQLSGAIPTQLGNLSSLQNLRVWHNQLSGSIPTQLGSLSNLEGLLLSDNRLTGSIPTQLGNLTSLRDLVLGQNQLSGSIPTQLVNLGTLSELDLYSNQLTGGIPTQLGNLSSLSFLDLGENQLSGTIPTQLGNLSSAAYLELPRNQLTGSIPTELGNLSSLSYLDLGGNQLSGSVPTQLAGLSSLWALLLRSNQLTGTVPTGLHGVSGWTFLWNALRAASGPYDDTQTVAPQGITATTGGTGSVLVSWTPIPFVEHDGGYQVLYAASPGGAFTQYGQTTDKTVSSMMVEGLNPGSTYWFEVQTVTQPHPDNQGTVVSEPSAPVSGSTASLGPAGALQLSLSSYRGSEGEAKTITVRRLGGSTGAVSVLYSTSPGTATPGVDYVPASEWLAWTDGEEKPKTLAVHILHSSGASGKTFNVNLSNPRGGATLGSPSTAVVTIGGSDFQNSGEGNTSSTGYGPALATRPNGSRLIVWAQAGADGDGLGLLAQRYVPSGSLVGDRILVTTTTTGDQRAPAVGSAVSGNFVVTWVGGTTGKESGSGGDGIFGRVFGPGGTPVTPELQLNGTALASATAVSVAVRPSSGSFLVAWQGTRSGAKQGGEGIFGRTFGAGGAPISPELVVDGGQTAEASHPATGFNDHGDGVVVWSRQDQFGWDDVYAQRVGVSGNLLGSPILVNVDTFRDQTKASVVVEESGDFVVLWQGPSLPDAQGNREEGTDMFLRRFTAAGVPEGDPVVVNPVIAGTQSDGQLAINGSGDCWAVWQEQGSGGGVGVFGRLLTSCTSFAGGQVPLYDPAVGTSLRSTVVSFSDTGAVTTVFVRDDSHEGAGSVVGYSLGQPGQEPPRRPGGRAGRP